MKDVTLISVLLKSNNCSMKHSSQNSKKKLSIPPLAYAAAAVAAIGGILFGFDTGIISGAILFVQHDFSMTISERSWAVSMVLVGAIIGSASGGYLSDKLGRRKSIISSAALVVIGTIIIAASPDVYLFFAGRFIIGTGIGVASFISPMYISEVAPKSIRGAMVSLNQLMVTVGILVAYMVSLYFSPSGNWRAMFFAAVIPAVALIIGMIVLPSSPRWLVFKGNVDKAMNVAERFTYDKEKADDAIRQMEIENKEQKNAKISELWSPSVRYVTIIGIMMAVLQQATGINTVIYFAPTIFEFAGYADATASIAASVGVGIVNVILTIVSIFLVDRVGRRPLLLVSLSGMILSLLGLSAVFSIGAASLGVYTAVFLMTYIASFAIGLGPIFWLLIAEIYPLRVRGKAMSVATVANWTSNFVISLTFLGLVSLLGTNTVFFMYAIVGVISLIFVLKLVPETKGLSLEEITKK
ncbi:sugar porter family MFS transporter [Candidatus Methanomassiliicoccus intestinalis]|uniref:sugar porter family MFS transporter n=2 Tax=Candidatus Methanomassiliicoccus intestinalis TaxID=1406512 RepID=UPI0037DD6D98